MTANDIASVLLEEEDFDAKEYVMGLSCTYVIAMDYHNVTYYYGIHWTKSLNDAYHCKTRKEADYLRDIVVPIEGASEAVVIPVLLDRSMP